MKRFISFVILGSILFVLSACDVPTTIPITYTISFYNGDTLYEEFIEVEPGTEFELDYLDEENMVFLGWSDGVNTYFDTYTALRDTTLTAVFQLATEVFELSYIDNQTQPMVTILSYRGMSSYLKIPQIIDGYIVSEIAYRAFENSSLIEIVIPIDVTLGNQAFRNSSRLEAVSFYGDYLLYQNETIPNATYDDILLDNPDTCIIDETKEEGWTFNVGCPIIEVISVSETMVIGGQEFFTYEALTDVNVTENTGLDGTQWSAFEGSVNIEKIEIPYNMFFILSVGFEVFPNLKEIIVDSNNEYYTSIDGVLYNKDITGLRYYPQGKEDIIYSIPTSVDQQIASVYFSGNPYLETISIPENFTEDFKVFALSGLKEIIVETGNNRYESIDGVLYDDDVLVRYPAAKLATAYTVQTGTTIIDKYAFEGNENLEALHLGTKLVTIKDNAFMNTVMLDTLVFPDTIEFIGMYVCFSSSINTLIIHSSEAFLIGTLNPATAWNDGINIYVKDEHLESYKTSQSWSQYTDYIFAQSTYIEE